MIDYEEELKKFEPCLDVADVEGVIYDREITDIMDVLQEMLREVKSNRRVREGEVDELHKLWSVPDGYRSGLLSALWSQCTDPEEGGLSFQALL